VHFLLESRCGLRMNCPGFLSIPEKTLREWRSKGYGPPWRKVGKHVRYEPDRVREWLDTLTGGADAA
jgi:hypothetical protein